MGPLREFCRYSRVRLWWRTVRAVYDWRRSLVRCAVMASVCRFFANEIAPFLVGLGMEEVDEAMVKIRTLEKAATDWDLERRKLVEDGWSNSVCMTCDEYDRWFGNG